MADENAPPQSQDDDELFSRENLRLISIVGGGTISVISAGVRFRELAQRSRGSKSDQTHFRVDDPREIMANQLLARGHASVDEILAASFGEWPPKGLDIVTAQPQRVPFHNIPEDVQQRTIERIGARAAGNATLVRERNIGIMDYVDGATPLRDANSTLGHEAVHILQGDHSSRLPHNIVIGANEFNALHGDDGLVLSIFDQHGDQAKLADKNNFYLADGIEIQARIHEIVMDGYQTWGLMPTNREELLVSMKNAGLKVPDAALKSISDDRLSSLNE